MAKESLSVIKVAEILGCHRMTVYRLIKTGRLPAFNVGSAVRVATVDLLAYRERNKYRPKRQTVAPKA